MANIVGVPDGKTGTRLEWVDLLRVIAVLLVVFEHAVLLTPLPLPSALVEISNVFSPFRIPVLVFLSGMLLPTSLAKGPRRYLYGKATSIVWPYLVWSVLIWGLANWGDDRPNLFVELFVNPTTTPMWFLAYLSVFYAIAMIVPRSATVYMVVPMLFIGALPSMPDNAQRFLYLFAFFLAGDVVTRYSSRILPFFFRRDVNSISLLLGSGLAVASFAGVTIKYEPLYAVLVFASIVASIPFARWLSMTRVGRRISAYGRETIVIFVVHWPAQVLAWNVLAKFGMTNAIVLFLGNLVVGLVAGFILISLKRRLPVLRYLFSLPRW